MVSISLQVCVYICKNKLCTRSSCWMESVPVVVAVYQVSLRQWDYQLSRAWAVRDVFLSYRGGVLFVENANRWTLSPVCRGGKSLDDVFVIRCESSDAASYQSRTSGLVVLTVTATGSLVTDGPLFGPPTSSSQLDLGTVSVLSPSLGASLKKTIKRLVLFILLHDHVGECLLHCHLPQIFWMKTTIKGLAYLISWLYTRR